MAKPPAPVPSQAALDAMVERGNVLLRTGDFASARLFYIQAARAGSARATTAAAWTYDPVVLEAMGVIGDHGDPAKALELYRQALALGDASAAEPIRRLSKP
jgi:TPR repeat protein